MAHLALWRRNCQLFPMPNPIVESPTGVTLIGGGPVAAARLREALELAPRLVAADSGADRALRLGHRPEAVIGDLDSLGPAARRELAGRLHHVAEQESTDFTKALRRIRAPFVLGVGFSGARLDHELAVLNALARHPEHRAVIIGSRDITLLAPAELQLQLPVGTRLSLFPLGPVRGSSSGLRWPIAGLDFAPAARIGASNIVSTPQVSLRFDTPRMLLILPRRQLGAVLDGLGLRAGDRSGGA